MNMEPAMLVYLEPVHPRATRPLTVPAAGTLGGKTIAFVNNGWRSFTVIGTRLDQALRERHGVATVRTYAVSASSAMPLDVLDRIVTECDAAIVGMAN